MSVVRRKRSGVAVAALAAVALVFGGSAAANAVTEPPLSPTVSQDTNQKASLTIHKRDTSNVGAAASGQLLAQAPGQPVGGVVFKVSRVLYNGTAISMRTNAGQQTAAQVLDSWNGQALSAPFSKSTASADVKTGTTASNGELLFDNLELGLYMVEETSTPAGVTPAGPFLVTLPLSQPGPHPTTSSWTGDWWLYNVHVYPKNAVRDLDDPDERPKKTVSDSGIQQPGQNTLWTISTKLMGTPHDVNGDGEVTGNEVHSFSGFAVRDDLDSRLTYSGGLTVKVNNGTALTAGNASADYTVTWSPNQTTAGAVMLIRFNATGLAKLNAAGNGGDLTVSFNTVSNGSGQISNTADVYTNGFDTTLGPDDQPFPPINPPTATVQKFGGITLAKTAADTNAVLAGAKFEVWLDVNKDGLLQKTGSNPDTQVSVSFDGGTTTKSVWETDNTGKVVIDGLRYSNWANGAQVTNTASAAYNKYLLVEVDAPSGYSLLSSPVPFEVTTPASGAGSTQLDVVNQPENSGLELPLTGGAGLGLLIGTGALLVGGGVLLLVLHVARRRREQAAAAVTLL